jgi:hypothetical protein
MVCLAETSLSTERDAHPFRKGRQSIDQRWSRLVLHSRDLNTLGSAVPQALRRQRTPADACSIRGCLVSGLGAMSILVSVLFFGGISSPVFAALSLLYFAGPLAMAYAVLRHRVLDLGVILRRGLQYALARRLLVSVVPAMASLFLLDLLLHGDKPILAVFRARGWMYIVFAAFAAVAYTNRQKWLEALDRRFFREQYDARRLLCEVVEEVHQTRNFDQEAPRVVARIESALHSGFVALLASESREKFYRSLAASPAGTGPPPLQKESKLLSLVRILGKPLEVPQTGRAFPTRGTRRRQLCTS